MSLLVLNAGSSSLKFEAFDDQAQDSLGHGIIDWAAGRKAASIHAKPTGASEWRSQGEIGDMRTAVSKALETLIKLRLLSEGYKEVMAVGHRVVHGGLEFQNPVVIDDSVRKVIAQLVGLAPLHNPPALESIVAAEQALPSVPHVAVFDTTFFSKLPPREYIYPGPYEWFSEWGIRRFGFHGISHEYCARRAAEMLGMRARFVVCHLGHGCSATAVRDGKAVSTTMGFTPLEGLMMGTRAGSVDPGILLHVQQRHGLSADTVERALNRYSGLLGVSGVSADFRKVEAAAKEGNDRARLALDMYSDRVRTTVGALATTLGGIDALIFTAGVGENNADLRAAVCNGLEHLGVKLDREKNTRCKPDQDISAPGSSCRILVVRTREALMIARVTRNLLSSRK